VTTGLHTGLRVAVMSASGALASEAVHNARVFQCTVSATLPTMMAGRSEVGAPNGQHGAGARSTRATPDNQGREKRLVMLSFRQMINGGIAAFIVVLLNSPPVLSMAYAESAAAADTREKSKPSGPAPTPTHNSHDAKRTAAKRGSETARPPRLSLEERRQLRRDIKAAGREIYPPRR